MSTEENEPEDIVTDGVQEEESPLPKESPAHQASGAGNPGAADGGGADTEGTKPPGPAEEQNSESGDDRGLTTEPSSSD